MIRKVARKPEAGTRPRKDVEKELFLEAVRSLRREDIPTKSADEMPDDSPSALPRNSGSRVVDTIDLHGMTGEQAIQYLSQTLGGLNGKIGKVRIVVGKGLHSPGGQGVLREIIPAWLDRKGCPSVTGWSWAGKKQGGNGVIIATLCAKALRKGK